MQDNIFNADCLEGIKRIPDAKVAFSQEETALFKNANLYHNHPHETLSPDDISFAINNQLKSIVAVTKDTRYEAHITPETVTKKKDEILKLYQKLGDEIERKMQKMNSAEYMDTLLNFQHLNIEALCKTLKVDYKRCPI